MNRLMVLQNEQWMVSQDSLDPKKAQFYESIFSQGNGYMGVRGFYEEEGSRKKHELCTYIAGVFDYIKPGITDMVNTPNFLYTRIELNGVPLNIENGRITEFSRVLNLKDGTLTRKMTFTDYKGYKTVLEATRFLSIDDVHIAGIRIKLTPKNYSGPIRFETGIDARVVNNPISDEQSKNNEDIVDFLHDVTAGVGAEDTRMINVVTGNTGYRICEAFTLDIDSSDGKMNLISEMKREERLVTETISLNVVKDVEYSMDKLVYVYTSRDVAAEKLDIEVSARIRTSTSKGFEGFFRENREAWAKKWEASDILVEGDDNVQLNLRYNIFQLIQGNAENDPYVSIGARSILHGRYKGCYFWDTEIFMLPFYIYTNPKAARNLLMYRYHTLDGARKNAKAMSVEGARYAWMCTFDGREQCETWDIGCCEVHITADVAYAIDHYYRVTGDETFIRDYGTEIYIETARYWNSRFTYQKEKDVYNMLFVKGPNEYGGVTQNNTYTTMMAIQNLKLAMDAVEMMKKKYPVQWDLLRDKLALRESEMDEWVDITHKAVINYDLQQKLYIEDDNFMKLEPLDMKKNKTDDSPLYNKISFDRLQRYRVLKQADVILLMTLLPDKFTQEEKKAAWDFYEPLTLHDSTLSFGTHALFAAKLGLMNQAMAYFQKSLCLDLDDIMYNTGREGIHTASLGATWQAIIFGFAGVEPTQEGIEARPNLPEAWKRLYFKLNYKGSVVAVEITKDSIQLLNV